jgi:hypothetical protein
MAAAVVAAYGVVLHEQLASDPWFPVALPHPPWQEASDALGIPLDPSVSIARNEPFFAIGSRAGVIPSVMALIVTFTIYFHRDLPRRTGIRAAALGGSAVALVLMEFMGSGIYARQGMADGGRIATYRSTMRMISDRPWFGTGQGTFAWAYPAYRSDAISMWGTWDRAHNTLLELAADMGVPLAALVVLGWILIVAVLIHGVRGRRQDLIVPVSALSVALLAVLHSLVDFSLQIPGYSIPALALVGAGLAQPFVSVRRRMNSDPAKFTFNTGFGPAGWRHCGVAATLTSSFCRCF